jgi:hypothetical protein
MVTTTIDLTPTEIRKVGWEHLTFFFEEDRRVTAKLRVEGKSFHSASTGVDTIYMPHTVS